jgi:ribosomal protein S18 acetylase RimI-like enzyme
MGSAASVTIATADDAEELHAALQHLVPQLSRSNPPPSLTAVQAMLAHDSVTQFLARRDDGSIVGVSTLATFPIPTAIRSWVEDVIVDEASNNQGVGRQLLDAMVARARELGAKTVDLTSRPSREAANHLYGKAGFGVRDTNVYRYELDGRDPGPGAVPGVG